MTDAPLGRPLRPPISRREPSRPDLHDLAWVVRRYKGWILAMTLVGMGVALLLSFRQTPVYESRTQVLVLPIEEVPATPLTEPPNLATESELVSSVAVARGVVLDLGIEEGTRALLEDLRVEPVPDTEILEIRYIHTDPSGARDRAQAFAEQYLRYRQGTGTARVEASAEDLDRQIRSLRRRSEALRVKIDALAPDDPDAVVLRNEAAVIQSQLLQRQLERLDVETGSFSAGEIVEPASLPSSPSSPKHLLSAAIGLAAGLALGVGSAFVRDRLSVRVRSADEFEDYLAAPVLGWIPRITGWRRKRALLISLERWRAPAAEAYRGLRTNVLSAMSVDGAKSLVVTSPNPGDGKSATVANLAVVLARSGKRVTIVSGDLRRPRLHEFFGVDGSVGLTDVLNGRTDAGAALKQFTFSTSPWTGPPAQPVWIMPSGRASQDDEELLTSESFRGLISELERASDIVLIDVPPVLPVTDALVVASTAGAVLLVIGPLSATRSTLVATRQHLDRVGARVVGEVLNGLSGRGPGYGSGYGY